LVADALRMIAPTISAEDAAQVAWDAIVVGAGVAGSTAAGLLSQNGQRVLLVERAALPRGKVCGGCLNARAVAGLSRAGAGAVVPSLGGQELERIRFVHRSGATAELELDTHGEHRSIAVSRGALDAALAQWAIGCGAAYMDRTRVVESVIDVDRRVVSAKRGDGMDVSLQGRAVLACDGLGSLLGRRADLAADTPSGAFSLSEKIGCSVVVPRDMLLDLPPRTITMVATSDGYVGAVDVEDGRVSIAGALKIDALRTTREVPGHMTARLLSLGGISWREEIDDAAWQTCPTLHRSVSEPSADRLLLLGDAAGYVEPITGEGMAWAVESAIAAAACLANGWGETTAADYSRSWSRHVGSSRRMARLAAFALDTPRRATLAVNALRRLPMVGRLIVRRLNTSSPQLGKCS